MLDQKRRAERIRRTIVAAAAVSALVVLPIAHADAGPSRSAASSCRSLALDLKRRLPNWGTELRFYWRVGQQLCFDFTGDSRRDIVFTAWAFMNHGAHYWAAYRRVPGGYRRVAYRNNCCGRLQRHPAAGISIGREGRSIFVTQPVYLDEDPACCPTGGWETAEWRWSRNALRLVGIVEDPP